MLFRRLFRTIIQAVVLQEPISHPFQNHKVYNFYVTQICQVLKLGKQFNRG